MDKNVKVKVSPAVNWLGLLGVIFVLLKVTGTSDVADWSWWLVLLPFYVGLAIVAGFAMLVAGVGALVFAGAWVLDSISRFKNKRKYPKFGK
jgi:membrane-bound ClpP family serine protease